MNILLKYKNQQTRSGYVGRAWMQHLVYETDDTVVATEVEADIAILYGMGPSNLVIYNRFRDAGKPTVTIDLGYWNRGGPHNQNAYYKVSVNYWHPNQYLMKLNSTPWRFNRHNLTIQPWKRDTEHCRHAVLVAGMGTKGCDLYGIRHQSWDRWAVEEIQKYTDRKIIYRPKPSEVNPKPIDGTILSQSHENVKDIISRSWCIVTHHSNVAVDALLLGIPAICYGGAASCTLKSKIKDVETPDYIDREQFFHNLAYCQFSLQEMTTGECWGYIKNKVLPLV